MTTMDDIKIKLPHLVGVGAPPADVGLGCGPSPVMTDVFRMLQAGSPRLALAKALGVPLAPYLINLTAAFPSTATTDVPDVGADQGNRITQDTLIDELVIRVQSLVSPVNLFTPLNDFFFNWQSGLQAKLRVVGAPRYDVAPSFTFLSTLANMVGGGHWPYGWILTYQQQLMMDFHAAVTLPDGFVPAQVECTFRGWVPVSETFVGMTNQEAFEGLRECGIDCGVFMQRFGCR